MTKSRWRESIRCLGSSHTDPEKDEQLRKTKLGIYFSPKKPPLQYYWRLWNSAIEAKRMQIRALLPAQYFPESRPLWYTRPELPSSSSLLFHKLGTMGQPYITYNPFLTNCLACEIRICLGELDIEIHNLIRTRDSTYRR